MRATEFNQTKGEAFEDELAKIMEDAGIDFSHHSRDESNDKNKYEVDFILEEHNIAIDAKWTGTQMHFEKYRTLDGQLYAEHEVFVVWMNNIHSYLRQRKEKGLSEVYFVYKIEINGFVDYRVVSLSDAQYIHLRKGPARTIRSQEMYNDPYDNFKEKENYRVTIFPEDSMDLDEFLNTLKG